MINISVEQAIKSKNPALYRRLPKFLIRWVERLIHQNEMSEFLKEHYNDSSIDFATNTIRFFGASIAVENEENIPITGRKIVVSNHPLGGIDGLALISVLGRYRQDIIFPVNDLLMQLEPMRQVFIPLNKHGKNSTDAVKQLHQAFASDHVILYFPAGLCSRKQKSKICDLTWKKTIIAKAKEYQRDIVLAHFDGKNSNRFYRIAAWRKKLGIKANIEMILLPDEAFRQKGKTVTIRFGKTISYTHFDNSKTEQEWAAWLKKQVYLLGNEDV
jgi:putative hemolysin